MNALKTIKINDRPVVVPSSLSFEKLKDGQFLVKYNGRSHYVTGGKAAGGSAREWFVDGLGDNAIAVTGPRDAINLIVGA